MVDIYDNLENFEDHITVERLVAENKELKIKLEEYDLKFEQLNKDILQDFDHLTMEHKCLQMNFSSLLKTARAEVERKAQAITVLNNEKDQLVLKFLSDTTNKNRKVHALVRPNRRNENKSTEAIQPKSIKKDLPAEHSDKDNPKFEKADKVHDEQRRKEAEGVNKKGEKKLHKMNEGETSQSNNKDTAVSQDDNGGLEIRWRPQGSDAAKLRSRRKSLPVSRPIIYSSDEEQIDTHKPKKPSTTGTEVRNEADISENKIPKVYDKSSATSSLDIDKQSSRRRRTPDSYNFKQVDGSDRYRDRKKYEVESYRHRKRYRSPEIIQRSEPCHNEHIDESRLTESPPRERYSRNKSRDRRPTHHRNRIYGNERIASEKEKFAGHSRDRLSQYEEHPYDRERLMATDKERPSERSRDRKLSHEREQLQDYERLAATDRRTVKNRKPDHRAQHEKDVQVDHKKLKRSADRSSDTSRCRRIHPDSDQLYDHERLMAADLERYKMMQYDGYKSIEQSPVHDESAKGIMSAEEPPTKRMRRASMRMVGDVAVDYIKSDKVDCQPLFDPTMYVRHSTCQSPDDIQVDNLKTSGPIREIMGTASSKLEDPRKTSKRYVKVIDEKNGVSFESISARNFDMASLSYGEKPSEQYSVNDIYKDLEVGEINDSAGEKDGLIDISHTNFEDNVTSSPEKAKEKEDLISPTHNNPRQEIEFSSMSKYKIPKVNTTQHVRSDMNINDAKNINKASPLELILGEMKAFGYLPKPTETPQICNKEELLDDSNTRIPLSKIVLEDRIESDQSVSRAMVEGDLELSDDSNDIDTYCAKYQENSKNVEKSKETSKDKVEERKTKIKTTKSKTSTTKSSSKETAQRKSKKTEYEVKNKKPKDIEATMTDLFGESSLITPEDLNLQTELDKPKSVCNPSLELLTTWDPASENKSHNLESEVKAFEEISKVSSKSAVIKKTVPIVDASTAMPSVSKQTDVCEKEFSENTIMSQTPDNDLVSVIGVTADDSVVKTVVISKGQQPDIVLNVERIGIENCTKENHELPACNQILDAVRGLATSTPYREPCLAKKESNTNDASSISCDTSGTTHIHDESSSTTNVSETSTKTSKIIRVVARYRRKKIIVA